MDSPAPQFLARFQYRQVTRGTKAQVSVILQALATIWWMLVSLSSDSRE
jgi:hypothetical protein